MRLETYQHLVDILVNSNFDEYKKLPQNSISSSVTSLYLNKLLERRSPTNGKKPVYWQLTVQQPDRCVSTIHR